MDPLSHSGLPAAFAALTDALAADFTAALPAGLTAAAGVGAAAALRIAKTALDLLIKLHSKAAPFLI